MLKKNIAVRGRKDIVAIFNKYAEISGNQDTGRPQAALDFINYVANLPMNDKTIEELKYAAKQRINDSEIKDDDVPSSIKIPIEVNESTWNMSMEVFKFVFNLQGNPQMPYFLRVSGMAYIRKLEEQNCEIRISNTEDLMSVEEFKKLSLDEKLVEIYKNLVVR